MLERTGKATIIQHCAVFGQLMTEVRWFKVCEPRRHAQHERAVYVNFIKPRKRVEAYYTIVPDNTRYLTIEDQWGKLLYDSRSEVPCDMEAWQKIRAEHGGVPALTVGKFSS